MIHWREGECRTILALLPEKSVQCVVSSPPYWGLRDYGVHDQGGLGLEPTFAEWLANMVEVMRAVWRVLRDDGTVWLNMGDAYAGGNQGAIFNPATHKPTNQSGGATSWTTRKHRTNNLSTIGGGLKPKDLIGQPWRLAFALQDDGWYLRSDIIWYKPNPMPESVTDRPTKAHEYVFLLTKQPRYFYDAEAIREAHAEPWRGNGEAEKNNWSVMGQRGSQESKRQYNPAGRNKRTVWSIPTQPYSGAHFATMPPALVAPCIQAGTSQHGCCAACGAPWRRVVETTALPNASFKGSRFDTGKTYTRDNGQRTQVGNRYLKQATGWTPTCSCIEIACIACSSVLEYSHERTSFSTKQHMSDLWKHFCSVAESTEVLQQTLLRQQEPHSSTALLQALSERIPTKIAPKPILQQILLQQMGCPTPSEYQGVVQKQHGLYPAVSPCSSSSVSSRLYDGAPSDHGRVDRTLPDASGNCASQEREQGRQPDRKPRTLDEAEARQDSETDILRDLPTLSPSFSRSGQCPHCGSQPYFLIPKTIPATVLDMFGGAGTTALVADRLGRDAISIELNAAYMALAQERVRAEMPLFLENTMEPEVAPVREPEQGTLFADTA